MTDTTWRAYYIPAGKPPIPVADRVVAVIERHERVTGQRVTHVRMHDQQTVGLDGPSGVVVTGKREVAVDTIWVALSGVL